MSGSRRVRGTRCPACMAYGLVLDDRGQLQCTRIGCPKPDYNQALESSVEKHALEMRSDELDQFTDWLTDNDPANYLEYQHARHKVLDERRGQA